MEHLAVCLLGLVASVQGYCFSHYGRQDKTVTGRVVPVCEYNGLDILNDSHFYTAACMACRCTDGLLQCCGFGVNDDNKQITVPSGCKVIADGCNPLVVMEADPTIDCFTGKPINPNQEAVPLIPDLFGSGNPGGIPVGARVTPVTTVSPGNNTKTGSVGTTAIPGRVPNVTPSPPVSGQNQIDPGFFFPSFGFDLAPSTDPPVSNSLGNMLLLGGLLNKR